MKDKFQQFKSGWDEDCLFNIKTGDMILVRWEDDTETFEKAEVHSRQSWGQEQGTFLGQSYMGTQHELFIVRSVHNRFSEVSLDGLYIYAESMDTFEEFKIVRERRRKEKEERELAATHTVLVLGEPFPVHTVDDALNRARANREAEKSV